MLTCYDMENHLVKEQYSPFSYKRYIVVSNLSWSFLPWEADLVALSDAGWLTEVEIKISIADLRRDAKKNKHALWPNEIIKEFYYAMPLEVWEKIKENPPIPDYAGIIVIDPADRCRCRIKREAKPNKGARKLSEIERYKIARLGAMRFWTRRVFDNSIKEKRGWNENN